MAVVALTAPVLDGGPRINPNRRLLSKVSEAQQKAILEAGGAIYVPQKIVVLAAGNGDDMQVLCRAERGKGKDAPGLSSIEQMKWLCHLPDLAPKGTNFVWYAGGYDASHVLKDLEFYLGWEIARQMDFSNHDLQDDPTEPDPPQMDEPSIRRRAVWITDDLDTPEQPAQAGVANGAVNRKKIGFAINYLKGKWLKIGMLRYPEDRNRWWKKGGMDFIKQIVIEDVIGFFQSSFLTAMEGMSSAIEISKEEQTREQEG